MQHLTTEELARLVDEAPDGAEAGHLEICGECRAELEALRAQTLELQRLPRTPAPRAQWPQLQARLHAEGLIAGGAPRRLPWAPHLMRAAAAITLFVAGGYTGALLWSAPAAPGAPLAQAPAANTAEAEAAVQQAEAAYLAALTRYAELTADPDAAADPVNRLAALEGIVLTTRAALQDAPADPVINGYHLAALSQREAILRQISRGAEGEWY